MALEAVDHDTVAIRAYESGAMNTILFCSQPFAPKEVDADFLTEHRAAIDAGFSTALFDHTLVTEGDVSRAIRRIPENIGSCVYRGWMLTASRYSELHDALMQRGAQLVNSPSAYRFCHHLPESYSALEGETPESVWFPVKGSVAFDEVFERLRIFGSAPLIVKDYVKSQKHHWNEACFIPHADDKASVERVVRRFLELQGEDLAEGLVFRRYVPLRIVGLHPRSKMPLAAEFRTFWFDGQLLLKHAYWGDLASVEPDLTPSDAWLHHISLQISSRFFTMDVALLDNGQWTVVELGDGQVAGLPEPQLAPQFYQKLRGITRETAHD